MKQQQPKSKNCRQCRRANIPEYFGRNGKSGQLLSRVNGVFNLLTGANTNEELQKVQEEIAPLLAANQDAIYLNTKLYNRVKTILNNAKN